MIWSIVSFYFLLLSQMNKPNRYFFFPFRNCWDHICAQSSLIRAHSPVLTNVPISLCRLPQFLDCIMSIVWIFSPSPGYFPIFLPFTTICFFQCFLGHFVFIFFYLNLFFAWSAYLENEWTWDRFRWRICKSPFFWAWPNFRWFFFWKKIASRTMTSFSKLPALLYGFIGHRTRFFFVNGSRPTASLLRALCSQLCSKASSRWLLFWLLGHACTNHTKHSYFLWGIC